MGFFKKKSPLFVRCSQTKRTKGTLSGVTQLSYGDTVEGSWARWPTAPCCPLRIHPKYWALPIDKNCPVKAKDSPRIPRAEGVLTHGVMLRLRALPGHALCGAVIQSWIKGAGAASPWLVPPAKWQHRALYWFTEVVFLGSWTQHNVCRELSCNFSSKFTAFVCLTAPLLLWRGCLRISTTGQWFLCLRISFVTMSEAHLSLISCVQ